MKILELIAASEDIVIILYSTDNGYEVAINDTDIKTFDYERNARDHYYRLVEENKLETNT
ncbi:hypothetical protein GCM10023310_70780 [Paenibacillus vulneris]|uniref:Uncharacterized protein n=1 Tax=Paenibacillus vulneris TaxID=1133364 RepID=A0ABW3UEY6_9BACL